MSDSRGMSAGAAWGWLALVVLVGLVLRWPALDWGSNLAGDHVSFIQLHPDEPRFVEIARGLHEGSAFRKSYVMGFAAPHRLALALAGNLTDEQLVRVARGVSLGAGLALAMIIYLLSLQWSKSFPVSLTAAGLVVINTWCITQSGYGTADMAYTMLLYLFAYLLMWGFRRGSGPVLLMAAGVAGMAMSMKFGVVLLPSVFLLWLGVPRRRALWSGAFVVTSVFMFLAMQGFAFDAESVRAIWASFTRDNLQGFEHQRWMNLPVYALQLVRTCGVPVACMALFGLWQCRADYRRVGWAGLLALLPLLLHGVGILFLNLPFPRHLLPLIPMALVLAAVATWRLGRARPAVLVVLVAWSLVLAITDARALWRDARGDTMRWMATNVSQQHTVWGSPYVGLPVAKFYPEGRPLDADVVILHEAWCYRFERSELNPFSPPVSEQLYHAYPAELLRYRSLLASVADGEGQVAFEAGPLSILPEQIIYENLWGSLNKFAGTCRVIVTETSETTHSLRPSQS